MKFDFERDVLKWSNETITRLGYEPAKEEDATSRLAQFFEIVRNQIPRIPRKVEVAREFTCPKTHEAGYKQVVSEIEGGLDLMPRCSRQQIKKAGYNDPMLLDWGISHLHLGVEKFKEGKNKGLIQGHKEVLFVFITDEIAYIVGVFDHSSWAKQEVLQIIYDNWPHILEPYKLRGVVGLARDVTDEGRKALRNGNVNSPVRIGNNTYMGPGGGITSAGTGANETHKALIVMRAIDELKDWIIKNLAYVEKEINLKIESVNFDVSRFILSRTFSIHAPENKIRIFIPSSDPVGSLVHPAQANIVEPVAENYSFYESDSSSGILVENLERN